MNIRILPYSPQISDLGSQINSKLISNLDTFLIDQKFNHAEHWRSFQLLILREYVMSELVLDYAENENKVSFRDWLNSTNPTLWSNGIDATRLTEDQEHQMIQSAKEKLLSVWEKLPKTCQNLKSAEDMLASIERHIFRKGLDREIFKNEEPRTNFSAVIILNDQNYYAGHVYSWENEKDPNECAMMGIRSSVENILKRCAKQELSRLAFRLLEAVRQLCMKKCADYKDPDQCFISVKAPEGPMPFFLKQAGFRPYNYLTQAYEDIEVPKISTMYKYNFQQSHLTKKKWH